MKKKQFEFSPINNALKGALYTALGLSSFSFATVNAAEDSDAQADDGASKIIITGSRIRRDGFENDEPVEVLSADDARAQGMTTLGQLLRSATVASGSPQVTAAISSEAVTGGGVGANTISLRGLGAARTLTLINGRRAGAAGTRGEVSSFDLNVIPLSAIERVEILKDGASSLYGSDAVAGVINIITKQDDIAVLDAFLTKPFESGGEEARISATWGKSSDKGSFMITADYQKNSELARGDRDFFDCSEDLIFDPATGERADNIDPRTGKIACGDVTWGHIWVYDYQDEATTNIFGSGTNLFQYDYDGDLGGLIPATPGGQPGNMTLPPGWYQVAYDRASDAVTNQDHPFQDEQTLRPEETKATIFASGEYELDSGATVYGEALISRRETLVNGYRQYYTFGTFGNSWSPDWMGAGNVGNALDYGWGGNVWFSPTPITNINDQKIEVDYTRVVTGVKGDIGNSTWYYDISMQASRSDGDYSQDIIYADVIYDQEFLLGSCVGIFHESSNQPCQDINWFDQELMRGNISPEIRNYLFGYETGNTLYEQFAFEAYASGEAFELPSGVVDIAAGVAYKTDEINDTPGEQTRLGNAWGQSSAGITAGKSTTKAVFAEAVAPLHDDVTLKVSARYTDVEDIGSDTTYKIGLAWNITDDLKFRASRGTSFRTPALFELYLANQSDFTSQRNIDPCVNWQDALDAGDITQTRADNCAADGVPGDYIGGSIDATVITGGGLGVLKPETSVAKTAGIVWTPDFGDNRLSLSLDYFNFLVEDEVETLSAGAITTGCYDSEFYPNEPLCDQFVRNALDQRIETISASFLNINSQKNAGYDLAINYDMNLSIGELRLESRHTFQIEDEVALFEGTNENRNGNIGDPKLTATFNAALVVDDWTYNWHINYVGSASNVAEDGGSTVTYRGEEYNIINWVDEVFYHSFSVSHNYDDNLSFTLGVANAFDKEPPTLSYQPNTLTQSDVTGGGNAAFFSQYDFVGRRMFANVTYNF